MEITEKQLDDLAKIKEKSEDDYEKNIVFITAGTLVLSLTFIEKIINLKESSAIWVLIGSWSLLAITLLLNLVSHQLSSFYHDKCRSFYANGDECADSETEKYNKRLRGINWFTTATLSIGILLLVLFCSLNAYKMSKQTKQSPSPSQQKGRTISAPLKPSQSNTSSNSGNTSSGGSKSNK